MRPASFLLVIATVVLAFAFAHGGLAQEVNKPRVTVATSGGTSTLNWDAAITGPANVEHSQDLSGWTTISTSNSTGTFQHTFGNATNGFYQLRWTPGAPQLTSAMITVQGGTLPQSSALAGHAVATFQIGKYEVTWEEWQETVAWAVTNGYQDLINVGEGSAGNHPVRTVDWYSALKWTNAKSERDGLTPVYKLEDAVYRTGQTVPSVNISANGYRLPTEVEWEWAARGGGNSQSLTYSGSNEVNAVAWWYYNSAGAAVGLFAGRGTWPVGGKGANELGIYDMSGNASEWCWDAIDAEHRQRRGGSWGSTSDSNCSNGYRESANRANAATAASNASGFRLARNAP